MNYKFKWYNVHIPNEADSFLKAIDSMKLSESSEFGFIRYGPFEGEVKYRFFSRKFIQVSTLDQDGNQSSEDVVTLKHVDFSFLFNSGLTVIRISDPNHSVKDLFNVFERIIGLGFYVVPFSFSFSSFNRLFQDNYETEILGIKVSDLVPSEGLLAKVELTSKVALDVDNIDFLHGYKYKVDSADFRLKNDGKKSRVFFSKTGLLRVSGDYVSDVVKLVDKFAFKHFLKNDTSRR